MFKRTQVCTGVMLALGGLMAATSMQALAQDSQRIEVTGSRIKTVQAEGVSPVLVLTAEQIKVEGVRNVEQLLNNLPQVFADQGGQVSNGSSGTSTVNLRNLGTNRTLVLINGRRMPAGSPGDLAADLNQIPLSLVKRVEILTGGASAVYGSDAVAGVVNIILDQNFEGLKLELNTQFYNHSQGSSATTEAVKARNFAVPGDISSDGQVNDFSLTLGGNFAGDKGNATVFIGHKTEKAILQSARDFSACALSAGGGEWACGGSSTSYPGRFITDNGNFTAADAQGNTRRWTTADVYNFQPLNYFQRPSDRWSASMLAHYDITPTMRAYAEGMFHDDHTVAQIAPSGLFGFDASGPNAVRWENPLLSDAWKDALGLTGPGTTADALILRRNVEGGGRQDDLRHTSYRGVLGLTGSVGDWTYDVNAVLGRVVYQETYKNDFSIARTARAMDVVTDPATGQAVCRSKLDGTDPNCVPYNIWSLDSIDPAALTYLSTPGFQKGFTSTNVVTASISGDLGAYGVKLPGASQGVGLSVGVERRTEKMELSTDTAFTTGDLAGQGGPTIGVGGQYSVNDIFGEVRVPILEKMPAAESLTFTGSFRHSSLSTKKTTNTYGAGLEWSPIKTVKVRGSYQQAVRAANIIELYRAQGVALYDNDADPCAGALDGNGLTAAGYSLAQCANTGVSAGQFGNIIDNPAGQYNYLQGGNPNLKPETSNSTTLGLVIQPIRDLTMTIDYFNLKVKDVIGLLPPTTTLTQCLETGDPAFCSLITRDSRGTLWATPAAQIIATNQNLGYKKTSGLDVEAAYGMRLGGMGKLDLTFVGTWLQKFEAEDVPGLGGYDCAGLYGDTCGTPLPKWRHKLRAAWSTPWKVDLSATWRHMASVKSDKTSSNPQLSGDVDPLVETLGSRNYFDLSAGYNVTKNVSILGIINNVFDKDPPIRESGSGFVNGNTYPVVYDSLGRRIALNVTVRF